jgi:hypothetical protein
MDFFPPFQEQMPLLLDYSQCFAQVALGHSAVRYDNHRNNVYARLAISVDVNMGRFMIIGVDDETHASFAQDCNHATE